MYIESEFTVLMPIRGHFPGPMTEELMSNTVMLDVMLEPFEDLSFLMGSENRMRVLETIADQPHTQEELVESIGTSNVTIGRILDDLLERGWLERRNDRYETTILGSAVAADMISLEKTISVAQEFRPITAYFSRSDLDFNPRLLSEAEMARSPRDSAFEHVDYWAQLFRAADEFRGLSTHVPVTLLEVFNELLRDGDFTLSSVLAGELVDKLMAETESRKALHEMIALGANIYRHDGGDWDYAIGVYDAEMMSVAGFDELGTPRVKIVSTAPPLRDWAESKVQDYREQSVLITVEDLG